MREIHDDATLARFLGTERSLADVVLCGLDLRPHAAALRGLELRDGVLLGCVLDPEDLVFAVEGGALVFPRLPGLPFEPWRTHLYTPEELFDAFDPSDPCSYCDCLDAQVYAHFLRTGGADEPPLLEAFARRLHDHGITQALESLLARHERVVAFMGGHAMRRDDPTYLEVAHMARDLAGRGIVVATGGGPGAMEAANLGARLCELDETGLAEAVKMLARAPHYADREWLAVAWDVRRTFSAALTASSLPTLGVPTFFYGHEPPNAFASHHAKYFANCTREEGLVSLATHGIVFAPGSAGTVQEVFQDACQNHYGTVRGLVSPMALFGVSYWTERLPVLPLLDQLSSGAGWSDRVMASDDPRAIVDFLVGEGPREANRASWSFCAALCADRAEGARALTDTVGEPG
jgi:predicted Rossmann-fold nucleotide-binding protein